MKNIFVLITSLFLMSGCAAKYGCSQFPETGCKPVSMVYDEVHKGARDYRKDTHKKTSKSRATHRHHGGFKGYHSASRHSHGGIINVQESTKGINYVDSGDPILSKPVVMRALVNIWDDRDDDLHGYQLIYLKLRDSEWIYSE